MTTSVTIETKVITGRIPKYWYQKLDPIWWFENDDEPRPPDDYKPNSTALLRVLAWYLRNPLMNFFNYVVGVSDRNYSVYGPAPVMATEWADVGSPLRWKWSVIKIGILRLPFVSYSGKHVLWHLGWEPGGQLQAKFNILKSSIQGV